MSIMLLFTAVIAAIIYISLLGKINGLEKRIAELEKTRREQSRAESDISAAPIAHVTQAAVPPARDASPVSAKPESMPDYLVVPATVRSTAVPDSVAKAPKPAIQPTAPSAFEQ